MTTLCYTLAIDTWWASITMNASVSSSVLACPAGSTSYCYSLSLDSAWLMTTHGVSLTMNSVVLYSIVYMMHERYR